MKKLLLYISIITINILPALAQQAKMYSVKTGKISFQSDAPFETIKAASNDVKGILDIQKKIFAFRVKMETFNGFNSALQKEHFNENYIESNKFPEATFSGKIIEDIDLSKEGNYSVRAKGNFTIHGVAQERIIKSDIIIKGGKIDIKSAFTVLLADHNIPIPKVVKDKLSGEISVEVNCKMEPHQP